MFAWGRGGGQVVSVLAFYSDDPSSNPAEVYNFSVKLLLKRTKINKKEAGVGPFFRKMFACLFVAIFWAVLAEICFAQMAINRPIWSHWLL